jgi:hypothetical protein
MPPSAPSGIVRPNWQASLARFTIFPQPGTPSQLTWKGLTGAIPAVTNTQGQNSSESGPFAGAQLTMQTQPGRIDLVLVPVPAPSAGGTQGFPAIGPFPQAVQPLLQALPGWSSALPPVIRVAVGLHLREPANSISAANQRLRSFVPQLGLDLSNASDFLLQLNFPKSSTVRNGLTINRLNKLLVQQAQQFLFGPTGVQTGMTATSAAMEIDVSTPADNASTLNGAGFDLLLRELAQTAIDLGNLGPI